MYCVTLQERPAFLEESYHEDQRIIRENNIKCSSGVLPAFYSKASILLIKAAGVQRLKRPGLCLPALQGPGYWVSKHHFFLLSL